MEEEKGVNAEKRTFTLTHDLLFDDCGDQKEASKY